ncbi:ArsR/SmtB family transcription factor [Pyrococcus yayanosii]|uniref:Transcription regulator ArsR n=1 Tax=Pyrococcus yayanosii (strain CH1 / JCM 16557) TaxID=529709 RepID=F8AJG6_PYRYC|nr:metalloregulator ArsR/SmtB family transcription factor [Pyrococcus yayanosii]AEH25161.1 transcription regulator ArsR [Pyrococcus yayanosii CH1]
MKLRELIERLNERQRKTVMGCLEKCQIFDLDEELELEPRGELQRFLKIMANPIRYGILKILRDRWMCVCLISEALGVDQTLVSHHIRILKELDLLHERREGKLRFYRTNEERLKEFIEMLAEEFGHGAPEGR